MRSFALLPLIAGLGYALPQDVCSTTTKQVIVPTRTATYLSTEIVTEHATSVKNLGTFTLVTTLSSTNTLQTLTSTTTLCGAAGIVSLPVATVTEYGSQNAAKKRALGLEPRACTVTVTSTTTYGQTYTYIPASKTSTFTAYTAFTQATVTSTKSGGTAYAIATATATEEVTCGSETTYPPSYTTTVSMDPKCSPAAMTSAYQGYGLDWLADTPTTGATYNTNTTDASECCQLCATSWQCAASAWDIRTGECRLEFPTNPLTMDMNCGEGMLAYYDAGPSTPMSLGTGWYVAELCGHVNYGSSKPDDGT